MSADLRMRPLTTLIIDDEFLARPRIKKLLTKHEDIEVVGECANGPEAVESILEKQPDFVFLDVQMPELDGFAVLEMVAEKYLPAVIFVTAYDKYAIKAFDVHALDYLLKPFNRKRFTEALTRLRGQLQQKKVGVEARQIYELLRCLPQPRKYLQRIVIQTAGRIFFLSTEEIDWIKAAGNYLELHTRNERHYYRSTMNHFAQKLDVEQFIRIHRSTIVNIARIKSLKRLPNGDFTIVLDNGTQFPSGRAYRGNVMRLLEDVSY